MAMWRQPEELRSSELQAGERYAKGWGGNTAEVNQEKVWTHRRGKGPLLGRGEEEGRTTIENSLHLSECMPTGPQRAGWLWHRLQVAKSLV